jgi:hypothetical protein
MQTAHERTIVLNVSNSLKTLGVEHRIDAVGRDGEGIALWYDPRLDDVVYATFLAHGVDEEYIDARLGETPDDTWMTVVAYDADEMFEKLSGAIKTALANR